MADFSIDIERYVAKTKGKLHRFTVEFLQDVNHEVIEGTPWITGWLRGSWHASIGSPAVEEGSLDPSGQMSVARMNLVAAQIVPGQTYYAANGASYARFVEYGTSRMAPRAFVRRTVARAEQIAEAAAARVAK